MDNNSIDSIFKNESFQLIFEDRPSLINDEIDDDIYEISKMESEEMLEKITPIIEKINEEGLSGEDRKEFKRYTHTLKGCVRMAGINRAGLVAHKMESLLDFIEVHKLNVFLVKGILEDELSKINFLLNNLHTSLNEEQLQWLDSIYGKSSNNKIEESQDNIKEEIYNVSKETQSKQVILSSEIKKDIETLSSPAEEPQQMPKTTEEAKQFIRVQSDIIDKILTDANAIRFTRSSLENSINQNHKSVSEIKMLTSKIHHMVKEIEIQAETQMLSSHAQANEDEKDFDPLEFDRFTRMQELTRLMNEVVADIEQNIGGLDFINKVQDNSINEQSISINNLMTELMKIRLVTFDSISNRFYKIARNTSKELNKKINLEIIGEKTELDKILLDKIISPLEHILRNSIAHGIEQPDEREMNGKSAFGKIIMDLHIDGHYAIIKVSDDGAGINLEKVKSIGIKKNLIKSDKEYTKNDIINLIFHSGFSTADSVSQVAGRGVGMDVVKNEILSVGGSIEIDTEKNKGSTFTLKVPVNMATNQSILTNAQGKLIAIPNMLIAEISSIKKQDLLEAYKNKKIKLGEETYDFYYMGHMLGLLGDEDVPNLLSHNTIIKIQYTSSTIVVHFDEILGVHEILIKPFGRIYGKIPGLLGATILGDGTQGSVINPVQLANFYNKNISSHAETNQKEAIKVVRKSKIMVVDDSLTVRMASSKMLDRNGFDIILGKDGKDGLEILQNTRDFDLPLIILSDIEMPNMDGFEFVKNLKLSDRLKHIPVIMITSRTAEKHKEHAFSLGASDYMGKPYNESELISKINSLSKNTN